MNRCADLEEQANGTWKVRLYLAPVDHLHRACRASEYMNIRVAYVKTFRGADRIANAWLRDNRISIADVAAASNGRVSIISVP